MIGDRLQLVRRRNGLTQAQFSEALDISATAYKNYEKGQTEPSVSYLLRVSEVYKVDFLWLATGSGAYEPDALLKTIWEAYSLVRTFGQTLPVKPPIEKEAEIVALLVRQWLETGKISNDSAKFMIERAA
jgi:transcriptional regulator with XRE-family HTH domain